MLPVPMMPQRIVLDIARTFHSLQLVSGTVLRPRHCGESPQRHGFQEELAQLLGAGGTGGELGHPVLWQCAGHEIPDVVRAVT